MRPALLALRPHLATRLVAVVALYPLAFALGLLSLGPLTLMARAFLGPAMMAGMPVMMSAMRPALMPALMVGATVGTMLGAMLAMAMVFAPLPALLWRRRLLRQVLVGGC